MKSPLPLRIKLSRGPECYRLVLFDTHRNSSVWLIDVGPYYFLGNLDGSRKCVKRIPT